MISLLKYIHANTNLNSIRPTTRDGGMLSDMSLTALIKCMREQKLNENSIGYIDPELVKAQTRGK